MQNYFKGEVSFKWLCGRISSIGSKARTTLHVSIIDSESDKIKSDYSCFNAVFLQSINLNLSYTLDRS